MTLFHQEGTSANVHLVDLEAVIEALSDVLVDYNVPTLKIVREFRETLTVYMEDA